jgi:hypothetical protein
MTTLMLRGCQAKRRGTPRRPRSNQRLRNHDQPQALWIYLRICRMHVVDALHVMGQAAVLTAAGPEALSSQDA